MKIPYNLYDGIHLLIFVFTLMPLIIWTGWQTDDDTGFILIWGWVLSQYNENQKFNRLLEGHDSGANENELDKYIMENGVIPEFVDINKAFVTWFSTVARIFKLSCFCVAAYWIYSNHPKEFLKLLAFILLLHFERSNRVLKRRIDKLIPQDKKQ